MNHPKSLFLILSVIAALFSFTVPVSAIEISIKGNVKDDGSGTFDVIYSARSSEIKGFFVGGYPFGPKVVESFFSGNGTTVKNAGYWANQKDTTLKNASFTIEFKDINQLKNLKGFTGNNISFDFSPSAEGKVFSMTVKPGGANQPAISLYRIELTFDGNVKKSNAQVAKDNTVTWYKDKNIDNKQNIVLNATVSSSGSSSASSTGDGKTENKSCGLFGFELPIFVFGYLLIGAFRTKNKA